MEQGQQHPHTRQAQPAAGPPRRDASGSGYGARRVVVALALFVCGLAAGAALAHFALERPALEAARARIEQQSHDMAATRARLAETVNAAAALEGRLMVEEGTRRGLETTLAALQAELGRAQDTVAFYEQLMPPGPKGAVSIRALDIERVGPNLKYRVLLMRSGASEKPFQGGLQFVAKGRLDGEEACVPLSTTTLPAAVKPPATEGVGAEEADDAGPLAVEFDEFQRSSGLLGIPEGFVPESVTVSVLEGRAVRATRSVDLPSSP